MAGQESLTKRG